MWAKIFVHNSITSRLEKAISINSRKDETSLVERFWSFGRSTNANSREWITYASKETTLFWKCTGVRYHGISLHLETVVVVEAERLLYLYARIELEARSYETVT